MTEHTSGEWTPDMTWETISYKGGNDGILFSYLGDCPDDIYLVAAAKDLLAACEELEKAEAHYRLTHDLHGDGSLEAGLAWDRLRKAGNRARAAIAKTQRPTAPSGAVQ